VEPERLIWTLWLLHSELPHLSDTEIELEAFTTTFGFSPVVDIVGPFMTLEFGKLIQVYSFERTSKTWRLVLVCQRN
jgi:hypothetical protein